MKKAWSTLATLALSATAAQAQPVVVNQGVTEAEVLSAQQAWCKALVDISSAHAQGGQPAAKALAEKVIDSAYGYQMGAVLFKPTLTVNPQTFRTTRAGALAYFVMPFDAIPDIFLGLGFTDDAAVLLAAFGAARLHITDAHRARARAWLRREEAIRSPAASAAMD